MQWHEKNPHATQPGFIKQANWEVKRWGRTQFASSYARGGMGYHAFAPSVGEAFVSPWRMKTERGHSVYNTRIKELKGAYGPHEKILAAGKNINEEAWSELSGWGKTKRVGMKTALPVLGHLATVGFIGYAGYAAGAAGGSHADVAKAMGAETSGVIGGAIGIKAGIGIGAAWGGLVGGAPGMAIGSAIGLVAGMMGGYTLGSEAFTGAVELGQGLVDGHRAKRAFNWVGSTAAFDTKKAHTMRQQSLQLMNRGMMSARSAMGREAVMLHQ